MLDTICLIVCVIFILLSSVSCAQIHAFNDLHRDFSLFIVTSRSILKCWCCWILAVCFSYTDIKHCLMYLLVSFYVCIWWTKKTTYIHLSSRRFLHTWGHLNCWFSYNRINGYTIYLHLYRFLFIRTYTYVVYQLWFWFVWIFFFIHSKACNINHFFDRIKTETTSCTN